MGNVCSYVKWRGDIELTSENFSEADVLCFSILSYIDLQGIAPDIGAQENKTLREITDTFFLPLQTDARLKGTMLYHPEENVLSLLWYMGHSKRFGEIKIIDCSKVENEFAGNHFYAYTALLPGGKRVVSFRGSEMTISAFKREFASSFTVMPDHKEALSYLQHSLKENEDNIFVCGHSSGGNMAVYAAERLDEISKKRIEKIYCFDGAGLSDEIDDKDGFIAVSKILNVYVPEYSVTGRIFRKDENLIMIHSSSKDIMQHDPMTYQVIKDKIIRGRKRDETSEIINNIISEKLSGTDEEKTIFTNELFLSLSSHGKKDLSDISGSSPFGFSSVVLSMTSDKRGFKQSFKNLFDSYKKRVKNINIGDIVKSDKFLISVIFLCLGILYIVFPVKFYSIIGAVISAAAFIWSLSRLYKSALSEENKGVKQKQIILYLIIMAFVMFMCTSANKLSVLATIAAAILFFYFAYKVIQKGIHTNRKLYKTLKLIVGGVCIFGGIFILISPESIKKISSYVIGVFILAAGIFFFILSITENYDEVKNEIEGTDESFYEDYE